MTRIATSNCIEMVAGGEVTPTQNQDETEKTARSNQSPAQIFTIASVESSIERTQKNALGKIESIVPSYPVHTFARWRLLVGV
ncbi:hypothetical protein [Haliangium ochraceum]|uniref:hypothetical protein n=1 Tax=Haliangium ochraceum TaxID=80816 RepID=UPI00126A20AE|nr:hypothetical protein [Haliangium ochraceum]